MFFFFYFDTFTNFLQRRKIIAKQLQHIYPAYFVLFFTAHTYNFFSFSYFEEATQLKKKFKCTHVNYKR